MKMLKTLRTCRFIIIRILAGIFTAAITLLFIIFKILITIPHPNSYLFQDFRYSLSCCCSPIKLTNKLHLIINTTLSLVSVLIIVNYCEKMLRIVQLISHQTHIVFLNLVFPQFPQFTLYKPAWIVDIYLILSYLGITSQISLTLDLIYIYNLPTIFMYKILVLSYSKILILIKFCYDIIQFQQQRWLTCKYQILRKTQKINKIIAICFILVLGQILVIVAFYYLWLAVVIILLMLVMNSIRNFLEIIRLLSPIIVILKGYTIFQKNTLKNHQQPRQLKQINQRIKLIRQISTNWTPLIKLQDIKDVFVGKDIMKSFSPHRFLHHTLPFSVSEVYQSFVYLDIENFKND